jgi:quercetin dioxygenase-like cupin family protein
MSRRSRFFSGSVFAFLAAIAVSTLAVTETSWPAGSDSAAAGAGLTAHDPFITLEDVAPRVISETASARFVHSANMTFAFWDLKAGGPGLPVHSHPHEQVAIVLEGSVELSVGGITRTMGPGEMAVIPSNAPHSAQILTDAKILDVFYPVREDYRNDVR